MRLLQRKRECLDATSIRQDFWDMSGIIRSVCLHWVPDVHLRDVAIRTGFDDDRR